MREIMIVSLAAASIGMFSGSPAFAQAMKPGEMMKDNQKGMVTRQTTQAPGVQHPTRTRRSARSAVVPREPAATGAVQPCLRGSPGCGAASRSAPPVLNTEGSSGGY
jgi:hypothetical protein